jgi:hypothetical protein
MSITEHNRNTDEDMRITPDSYRETIEKTIKNTDENSRFQGYIYHKCTMG